MVAFNKKELEEFLSEKNRLIFIDMGECENPLFLKVSEEECTVGRLSELPELVGYAFTWLKK